MADAIKYLRQIEILDHRINAKVEERQRVLDMLFRVTPVLRDTVTSGGASGHDKIENGIAKLAEYADEINADIDKFIDVKREVNAVIDRVENEKRRTVLAKRYVAYERFEKIAVDMNMGIRNVWYIHNKALLDVSRILEEEDSGKEKEN